LKAVPASRQFLTCAEHREREQRRITIFVSFVFFADRVNAKSGKLLGICSSTDGFNMRQA
jgi:hypothetical protein